MKIRMLLFGLAFSPLFANAQLDSAVKMVLDAYEKAQAQYGVYGDCGHELDASLSMVKSMENRGLDQLITISLEQEMAMGKRIHDTLISQYRVVENPVLQSQLGKIVLDTILAPLLKRPDISYTITILESEDINAFATIGGYVYLTSGILGFIESVDELAFIVAHEISHVDYEHVLRKHKKLLAVRGLSLNYNLPQYEEVAGDMVMSLSAPFDQIDEYEADRNAFRLALAAGFDSHRFADFFRRTLQTTNEGAGDFVKMSRTHPFSEDRISCVEYYIGNPDKL